MCTQCARRDDAAQTTDQQYDCGTARLRCGGGGGGLWACGAAVAARARLPESLDVRELTIARSFARSSSSDQIRSDEFTNIMYSKLRPELS